MLGSKENLRKQMAIQITDIDSMVSRDYFLRRIDEAVNFSFIRDKVAQTQPSRLLRHFKAD